MAHIGVGAFHRCHQAEYTDDMLGRRFDRWGVVGINIRPPTSPTRSAGRTASTRASLIRQDQTVEARVIGSIVRVVDSQASPEPALDVLASPEIDVVTMTVTEKGYCHRPASGALDLDASRHRARPRQPEDAAQPARPDRCGRWSCACRRTAGR